ncbi:MAG: PKD domain-containing protein [Candidatus Wallbacteria bacterium]|nr:PKD domain-containing protein [Candidatus Wallbacteria bacterium]
MFPKQIRATAFLVTLAALAVTAAGCGGDGAGPVPEPTPGSAPPSGSTPRTFSVRTVSGQATKGPFLPGSTARAFRIENGIRGATLGPAARVQAGGAFSISITDTAFTGDALVEAQGTFVDEATGVTLDTAATPLRGIAFSLNIGASPANVQVTPLTEIAVTLAIARGGLTAANLRQALADVGAKFEIANPGVTAPSQPGRATRSSTSEPDRYGLLLAGLSGEALNKGLPVLTLVAAMDADASDGRFDGTLGGQPILLTNGSGQTQIYSAASLTSELSSGIDRFLASPGNSTGLGPSDPLATTVKNPLSNPNSPPRAFASVSPSLVLTGDPVRLDGRGSSDPDGTGLSYRWSATLDGIPTPVFGQLGPEAIVTATDPGTYAVTLVVFDTGGLAGLATGQFVVRARPPDPVPAALSPGTATSPQTLVLAGNAFVLTVPVTNTGGTDARAAAASLSFDDPRVSATARTDNPSVIRTGATASFVFDVRTTTQTPIGSLTATLRMQAKDARTQRVFSLARVVTLPVTVQLPPPAPALGFANLTAPSRSLNAGERTTLSVDVVNDGPGAVTATVTDARIAFDTPEIVGGLNPESAREVPPGGRATLSFTVAVGPLAPIGADTYRISVSAIGSLSRLPLTATPALQSALPVTTGARLRVTTLTAVPSRVTSGAFIDVAGSVTNEGSVAALIARVQLRIGAQLRAPGSLTLGGVPVTPPLVMSPGGPPLAFVLRVDSRTLPVDLSLGVEAVIGASDSNDGQPVPVIQPSPPPVVLVQTPAVLRIDSFVPTPKLVSQGQRVRLSLIVGNGGSASTTGARIDLTFKQPGGADVSTAFTTSPVGLQQTVIPGNTRLLYEFDVVVPATASTLGPVTVSAVLRGHDANSGVALAAGPATLAWTVQTPADVAFGSLVLQPLISQGQTARATFTVSNLGQATARVVTIGLVFQTPDGLSAVAKPNPISIPGLSTVTFAFDLVSVANTNPGTRTALTTITVQDVNSGALPAVRNFASRQFTIQIPPRLTIVSVQGDRGANLGQRNNPITMIVRNDGQATAQINVATILAAQTGFNERLVPLSQLPLLLPGGTARTLNYRADVPATAVPGQVNLSGQLVFFDVNTSISAVLNNPSAGFLLVQREAGLVNGDITVVIPQAIDRGGSAARLRLQVHDGTAQSASVQITTATISFSIRGNSVSPQYSVAFPADLLTRPVPGGTTGSFDFDVTAFVTATKFEQVIVTAAVTVQDVNDLTQTSSSGASSFFVREAASEVRGQQDFLSGQPNRGGQPSALTMNLPEAVATDGQHLAVSDTANNRVLLFSTLLTTDTAARVFLGQPSPFSNTPQPISSDSLRAPSGLAFANPRLLVADRGSNRVLVYNDTGLLFAGQKSANFVLGQTVFSAGNANRTTVPNTPPDLTTLNGPSDVAVSGSAVIVADTNNNRVLLYNNFGSLTNGEAASVVLGQASISGFLPNRGFPSPGLNTMNFPVSVTVAGTRLFVADRENHRVLVWRNLNAILAGGQIGPSADFALGQASGSGGQPDRGIGSTNMGGFNRPSSVRVGGTRLYVSDSFNNRIVVYSNQALANADGALPDELLGQALFTDNSLVGPTSARDAFSLLSPYQGAALSATTYAVADQLNNRVLTIPLP